MHVTGERSEKRDVLHLLAIVENALVEVGDRPALRNRKVERLRERRRRGSGNRAAPGAEFRELLPVLVERQITVHHAGDADRVQRGDSAAVVLLQFRVGGLHTLDGIGHPIRPHSTG